LRLKVGGKRKKKWRDKLKIMAKELRNYGRKEMVGIRYKLREM